MAKKKDDIPEWVTDEIKNAKFGKPEQLTKNGYVLEVYDKDNKIDAQFYDPVEDGRSIVTLDLSKKIKHDYNKYEERLKEFSENFDNNGAEKTSKIVSEILEKKN